MRWPLVLGTWALVLATSHCSPGDPQAEATAQVVAAAQAQAQALVDACPQHVAALRRYLGDAPDSPVYFGFHSDIALATTEHGADVGAGIPVFAFLDGQFEHDAQRLRREEFLQQWAHELKVAADRGEASGQASGPPRLLLAADRNLPVSEVWQLQALLPPATEILLIADRANDVGPPAPPLPAKVAEAMKAAPDQRSVLLAEELSRVIGLCPALVELFEALAVMSPDVRSQTLRRELPDRLAACRCFTADIDTLIATTWFLTGSNEPTKRQLPLPTPEAATAANAVTVADLVRMQASR